VWARQWLELAGVLGGAAARSVAWEQGASERTNGMESWGICSARARARGGRWPLPWPGHGDGEVATGGLLWAAWHCRGGSSVRPRAVEKLRSDAWVPARSKGGRLALHGGRAALKNRAGSLAGGRG